MVHITVFMRMKASWSFTRDRPIYSNGLIIPEDFVIAARTTVVRGVEPFLRHITL